MKKKKTALFIGRFQPFHKGHLHAIKSVLKRFDKVVIVVGSINKKNKENPFSFVQRKKMIDAVLMKYKNRYKIIGIPDVINDEKWVRSTLKKAKFDVVVTANAWTRRCFKNFKTIKPRLIRPKTYDASKIRKLMKKKKRWQHLVPKVPLGSFL